MNADSLIHLGAILNKYSFVDQFRRHSKQLQMRWYIWALFKTNAGSLVHVGATPKKCRFVDSCLRYSKQLQICWFTRKHWCLSSQKLGWLAGWLGTLVSLFTRARGLGTSASFLTKAKGSGTWAFILHMGGSKVWATSLGIRHLLI